jgi:hypothetical protein
VAQAFLRKLESAEHKPIAAHWPVERLRGHNHAFTLRSSRAKIGASSDGGDLVQSRIMTKDQSQTSAIIHELCHHSGLWAIGNYEPAGDEVYGVANRESLAMIIEGKATKNAESYAESYAFFNLVA